MKNSSCFCLLLCLYMALAGKAQRIVPRDTMTFAVMGNSISTYYDYLPSGYAVYYSQEREKKYGIQAGDTWWNQLSRLSGMTFLTNSSWSGSRVAGDIANSNSPFISTHRITSVGRAGVPDAILIAGGTNDWSTAKVPLGEYQETGPFTDSLSFRGAYTMLLDRLHRKYPDMKLICLSIFPRGNAVSEKNAKGWSQADANASIKKIAAQFGGYYVDCTAVAFSSDWYTYTIDKLHPTTAGHTLLAQRIRQVLVTQKVITTGLKQNGEVDEAPCLLDLHFTEDGIVNSGTVETNVGRRGTASTFYDSEHDTWLGCTKGLTSGFFYALYDADSPLVEAFNGSVTWEALVRLDALADSKNSIAHSSFFSTEQDGGWSFYNSGTAATFSYTHQSGLKSVVKNLTADSIMVAGRFYHLVVTMDRLSHTIRYYVNGKLVCTGTRVGTDMQLPNCGSIRRKRNMWVSLGGNPAVGTFTSGNEAGIASTFAFARIYDGALTQKAAKALYDDHVREFTEPVQHQEPLLLDCDFRADGPVNHAAAYADCPVETVGTVPFAYNAEAGFWEAVFDGTKTNFMKYDFAARIDMMHQLGDAYSVEVYCRNATPLPSASQRPFGFVSAFGPGLQTTAQGKVGYTTTTQGEKSDGSYARTQWAWLDAGSLSEDYTHYVICYDRKAGISRFIVNGEERAARTLTAKECTVFDWAKNEWMAIGGDANGLYATTTSVGSFPFVGSIARLRVWNRALTTDEAAGLMQQQQHPGLTVTTGTAGYAAVCAPFAFCVPAGVTAYVVDQVSGVYAYLRPVALDGYLVPYGAPLILKAAPKTAITLQPVREEEAPMALQPDLSGNLLIGDFGCRPLAIGEGYYQNPSGNYMSRVTVARTLPACSAWLPSSATRASLTFKEEEITGIVALPQRQHADWTASPYNLAGQRVGRAHGGGILVRDGRKILSR